jgi:hypothetical protein
LIIISQTKEAHMCIGFEVGLLAPRVVGWAADPDHGALPVKGLVDEVLAGQFTADKPYPGHGNSRFHDKRGKKVEEGRDKAVKKRALACENLERVTGIEPALSAWEADVLPLNYIREWLVG